MRGQEPHARADAVATARAGAEPVGEPLGQPPLDATRRNDDDLLGERVVERFREQRAEPVGEQVGRIGTMHLQRHDDLPTWRHSAPGTTLGHLTPGFRWPV